MARAMIDIMEDANGDLLLTGGDISLGDCTITHQRDILLARKCEYRTTPLVGVGIEDFLDDESPEDLQRSIRVQFGKDGMNVEKIAFESAGKINIEAKYD